MKKIAICASVSFYESVVEVKNILSQAGFDVLIPEVAAQMEKENNFDIEAYSSEFASTDSLAKKALMDAHFDLIRQSDGVLILNKTKHGQTGYIGPNVLMELTVGYISKKPLFLFTAPSEQLPAYREIIALQPMVLDGKLELIEDYYK